MFTSTLMAIVFGILSTFVLGIVIAWVIGLNKLNGDSNQPPTEVPHH